MKIAYLILAYGNFEHLERLVKTLSGDGAAFFIHIDKKSAMPDGLLKKETENGEVKFIERIPVNWGGWSQTQATINMMKEAVKGDFDYYVFLSGEDYPIRPNDFLYEKLRSGGEYINIIKGFQVHKPERRIKYYYFDCFNRRDKSSLKTRIILKLERVIWKSRIRKRRYPFKEVFFGSAYWTLSRACVKYILDFAAANPRFVNFFKTSLSSDEVFFHTIIGNSEFLSRCRNNLTFTDWSIDPSGPAVINEKHLELFKKQKEFEGSYGKYQPFFARKFKDQSGEIVKQIDRELR